VTSITASVPGENICLYSKTIHLFHEFCAPDATKGAAQRFLRKRAQPFPTAALQFRQRRPIIGELDKLLTKAMKKLAIGGAAVVLATLAVSIAYGRLNDTGMPVKTAVVEIGPVTAFVSATGHVISREEMTVNSPIAAQLDMVPVKDGDSVQKGQTLARFDGREFAVETEKAIAKLRRAEQSATEAQDDYQRLQQVFQAGGEALKTVDDAKSRWQAMQQELQIAKQELRQARNQQQKLQIVAPAASTVTARHARAGAWVKAGDPLFKLAPAGEREIEVKFDAGDSAAAAVGKAAAVTSDAHPGREWQEKVTWVAPVTNKEGAGNTLNVRMSLGTDAPPLVLGQQVEVKVSSAAVEQTLRVSASAIISRQGRQMIGIIRDGRVHLMPITTGVEGVAWVEVTRGLAQGQRLILPEGKALREGDKVSFAADPVAP
jgi:membrane fusion protein (multidrug efflux system)